MSTIGIKTDARRPDAPAAATPGRTKLVVGHCLSNGRTSNPETQIER
jgi:hypothetical protein